tara:strand:- start:116 stop:1051 length:936 start_codon:yes stop_codon:yes gene_type:complete
MIYLTKKLKTLIIVIILLSISFATNAVENRIIYKVNNQIITSYDLKKEFRYLALINPRINNLTKDQIFEISKNSIIREKIKKIEILNHLEKIIIDENYSNKMIKETYSKVGLKNIDEFSELLNDMSISLDEFKEKLAIEALWNQLVYEKYKSKVKIDLIKLKEEVSSKKIQKIYNLSEIVFNIEQSKDLSNKLNLIFNDISEEGFENAAVIHSISDTRSLGGELGWVNENSISEKLKTKINTLEIGKYTEAITIPGGFLILKLNDIKEETISLNKDDEINKLIKIKTNQQLNRFSNIYFKKIEKNIKIEKI